MRDQLLGYLLNALDDADRQEVERRLQEDGQLRRELEAMQASLDPLACDVGHVSPPPRLAERTCELVAAHAKVSVTAVVARASMPSRDWRMIDTMIVAAIVAASGMVFFPALMQSRSATQIDACQNNLRQLHAALVRYADDHGGFFPRIAPSGNQSVAGMYAVKLLEEGYVDSPQWFVCPSSPLAENSASLEIPSTVQLEAASGERLRKYHATMGGSYGYSLGYTDGGRYRNTRCLQRSRYAVLADALDPESGRRNSCNHGGCGQNVLLEDGHVDYLTQCSMDGLHDDVYHNDAGQIAAGLHQDDTVIGHSAVRPVAQAVAH